MAIANPSRCRGRAWLYLVFGLGLLLAGGILRGIDLGGNALVHTLLEHSAALLAFIVGTIALIRYYSRKNPTFLFIGAGFLGTGFLDGYHAIVTSGLFDEVITAYAHDALVPWSGLASRLCLSVCLWLSWLAWKHPGQQLHPSRAREIEVYSIIGTLTLGLFVLFAFVNLPAGLHPTWLISRPQELIPGLFFLLALLGYLRKGDWKNGGFEHWLVLALIPSCLGQIVFMPLSSVLYDNAYIMAHSTRLLSYTLVLVGLLISMYRLFRQAELSAEQIRITNLSLVKEMAEHQRAVAALKLDEQRLKTLLQLNEMTDASLQQLTDFSLEEAVRLTRSTMGYLAFMDENESILTMHSWSKDAMKECALPEKPFVYPIEKTGLWGECVRQRKPVITNDYSLPNSAKKGCPEGHVAIKRHMNVPVFEGNRIVAVAGVGNKEEPYDELDVAQLRLLMQGMWQILQRRRTEGALEDSRLLFTKFMDNSPAVAFMKDRAGRMLYVNRTYERVFHTTLAAVEGKTDFDLWPQDVAQRLRKTDEAILSGDRAVEVLEIVPTPEGGYRRWLAFKFPFRDGADELRLGGMAVDVTERERAQEELRTLNETLEKRVAERTALAEQRARDLERSNVELEQFAYVASHDLQEPLRSVSSFTQLLSRRYAGKLDADADEFIQYVVTGANRMSAMIKDLLAYSRAGRADKPLKPTNCEAAFNEAITNLRLNIEETSAVIEHGPLPTIMADASQLVRLFQNLLSNAIKFHADAPPRVFVGAERQQDGWLFKVQDNGIGIAPEQFKRLFLIFQRLHDPTLYSGSGIGLAVCKKIVERHGGRIWVESVPGQGATFFFTIPDPIVPDPCI